jgi:hypothetical protein
VLGVGIGLFIAKMNNPFAFLPDPATVSPQAGTSSNPKTEMEPRISRMGTDEERAMVTKQGIRA